MTNYYYNVNGTEFLDTTAFGDGWKKAKALATEEHCGITRIVAKEGKISYQFYHKGGMFLDEKYFKKEDYKIF